MRRKLKWGRWQNGDYGESLWKLHVIGKEMGQWLKGDVGQGKLFVVV